MLDQFEQHASGGLRVNKCYQAAARTHAGLLVNKPCAITFEFGELFSNIVHADGNMVNAGTALVQKPPNR
jgi:hypothetical protein